MTNPPRNTTTPMGQSSTSSPTPTKMAFIPLLIAIGICVGISIFPQVLVADGIANHAAASCLFWSMSAGFIRGVGFIPKNRVLRWVFSNWACFAGVLATCLLMWVKF